MKDLQQTIQVRLHEALGAAQTQNIVLTAYLEERDAAIKTLNERIAALEKEKPEGETE